MTREQELLDAQQNLLFWMDAQQWDSAKALTTLSIVLGILIGRISTNEFHLDRGISNFHMAIAMAAQTAFAEGQHV